MGSAWAHALSFTLHCLNINLSKFYLINEVCVSGFLLSRGNYQVGELYKCPVSSQTLTLGEVTIHFSWPMFLFLCIYSC